MSDNTNLIAQARAESERCIHDGLFKTAEVFDALGDALKAAEADNAKLREALDWIEAEPEDPLKVQLWARAALAGSDQ